LPLPRGCRSRPRARDWTPVAVGESVAHGPDRSKIAGPLASHPIGKSFV
jgi:hypothetical protein